MRFFSRPRFGNLFGLFAHSVHLAVPSDPSSRTPPFIERLWMPAYAVLAHTVSRKGEKRVWTAVEGINGEFSLLECSDELGERDIDGEMFPPTIDETQVGALARKGLLQYILSQRGQMNKPLVEAIEDILPYHYPVWVCYYRRRGVFLDVKVLDARTGKSGGAKMRISVLHALVNEKKEKAALAATSAPLER